MNIQGQHNYAVVGQKLTGTDIGSLTIQFHKLADLSDKLVVLTDDVIEDADEDAIERMRSPIKDQMHNIFQHMARQKGSSVNEECDRVNVMLRYLADEGIDPCEDPGLVEALDRYAIRFFPRG